MQTIKELKDSFVSETKLIITDVKNFYTFSDYQINWKPEPKRWSIAECINHLSVTNKLYYNEMTAQFATKQIRCDCSSTPVKHKFFSKLIIKSVDPSNLKKVKTFKVFMPSASKYSKSVFDEFIEVQEKLINLINSFKELNLNKYIMASPAAKFIKENFSDVLEIIRLHDRKHLIQAQNIFNHKNFPKN